MIEDKEKVQGLYDTKRIIEAEIEGVIEREVLPRKKAIEAINNALAFLCAEAPVNIVPPKLPAQEVSKVAHPPKKRVLAGDRKSRAIPEADIERVLLSEVLSNVPIKSAALSALLAKRFDVRNTGGFQHKVRTILKTMPNIELINYGRGHNKGFYWRKKGE